MVQELRETTDEMMKADDKAVQDILNRRPKGHYWIVIHHKPSKLRMKSGEQVLMRVVKDYDTKPKPLLGTIILEVKDGDVISHSINLHDMPIDWERLSPHLGFESEALVQKKPNLAGAYLYNN